MNSRPPPLRARENRYNEAAERDASWSPSVSVVIPAYNRPDRLDATLAGLANQTVTPDAVVVVDDGSDDDLGTVVDRYDDRLPVTLVRKERDGFGAGRARNLGAAESRADVLIFVDSDCIPAPTFVEHHLWWHRRASNLVVVGSRYHVDAETITPDLAESNFDAVRASAHKIPADGSPDDWRRLFYRRNRKLMIGDTAYRAVLSSNMSVDAALFERVGGFSDAFSAWGGEDTELGWRLWNEGAFIVAENEAVVLHQLEPGEDRTWRKESLARNKLLMADRVPNRFYRTAPSAFHLVPRVSWIVVVTSTQEVEHAWEELSRSTYPDAEIVVTGLPSALEGVEKVVGNARVVTVPGPDLRRAVEASRGEFLAVIDGRLTPARRMLEHAIRRFDRDSRLEVVRGAYAMNGASTFRRFRDLDAIDTANGRGAPLFAVIRRREAMKHMGTDAPDWRAIFEQCKVELLANDAVEGDAAHFDLPRPARVPLGPAEIASAGLEDSARTVVRAVRNKRGNSGGATSRAVPEVAKIAIRYVGWTGHQNLGDEAMLTATRQLLPWADVDPSARTYHVLMLGGGTLFNANGGYLSRFDELDGQQIDTVVFGTGVRSPKFWDVTEPMDEWWSILDASLSVTVRGPDSEGHLRAFGYEGSIEVVGDPALALVRPENVERVAGRVVLCPLHTGGQLWGGDDAAVLEGLAATAARLSAAGHEVVIMTAHPADDRWAMEIMTRSGIPLDAFVPGYADLDATLELLASSNLVIGERLHSVVLAAAVGTPFVAVEYRPKLLDFARSVGNADAVIRTDQMNRLDEVVDHALANLKSQSLTVATQVEALRERQMAVSTNLATHLAT